MNKELAKTLTTALVQFVDRERPRGSMRCSNVACTALEKALVDNDFESVEDFIQYKLSGLTEFEQGFLERVFHQKPEDLDDVTKEIFLEDAHFVFDLAREQLIKDGYVIEKKAFHDAVKKVDKENELAKKHLEGYIKGREDTPRKMRDFIESHFNTQSGTSTSTLHGNASVTDGKEHNPSFTN